MTLTDTGAKAVLYTHDTSDENSVRFRIVADFQLQGYVIDGVVPVPPFDNLEMRSLCLAFGSEVAPATLQEVNDLMIRFVTAYVLQARTPTEKAFLKRLDEIDAEIKDYHRSTWRLQLLLGKRGMRADLSRIRRGTLNVSQCMRILLRKYDLNLDPELTALSEKLRSERARLEGLDRRLGRPRQDLLQKFLDAVLSVLLQSGHTCELPGSDFRKRGAQSRDNPTVDFCDKLMEICDTRRQEAIDRSNVGKSERDRLKKLLRDEYGKSRVVLLRYLRKSLQRARIAQSHMAS